MMNASYHSRLPEKLAAAEAREADERGAKATRAYYEAQTPFIATTSRYNLGYIGRGYDLFKGNPLSDDGVVDQGFRLPIMDLPYTYKFTADGNYRIPDNVDVISESSAKFGSSLHTVQSESDYKSMLSVDASVNGHGSGWGVSASFSASASYQKNTREIQKGETTTLSVVSRAVVYRARMSETSKSSKVNDYFEKAVTLLPMDDCESGPLQEMYISLIREFGTHYTTEVVMGAKAVQQLTFLKSDLSKLESEGISAKVAAEASFSGFGASGGGGFSVGAKSKEEAINQVKNTNKEQYEYYIGGNPPSGKFSSGNTESLREWARSADEKPVPIQYKMSSIESLLKPGYFKHLTYGLFERRRCLRSALYAYCKQTSSPALCSPPDEASFSSRRKRQTDNLPVDGIKFGDFISLSNVQSNQYLSLSDSTGYMQGIVTKPLVPVNTFSDYGGLFQIKSNDDDTTTVGTPLTYGQVFKLVTVEGENLLTGNTFIDDVNDAPINKLQDVFSGKDSQKYSSSSDLSSLSIFLRSYKSRPYLISLKLQCNGNKNYSVQVNLEGSEGIIDFKIKHACGTVTAWYHSAFTDKSIGKLEWSHFMSSDGTASIKGIQIRTGERGYILRYRQENLKLSKQVEKLQMDNEGSKTAKVDIYPTQFAFLSKNHPLGSRVRRRDVVFVEVVSAIERKLFWGKPASHLLSHKDGRVTITEKTPAPHKPLSAQNCSDIISPGNEILSEVTITDNKYFVSFSVDVMIRSATFKTTKSVESNNLKVEYISRNSSHFQRLQNYIREPISGLTQRIDLKFSMDMYISALKISGNEDFAINNASVLIYGCPAALFEDKPLNTKSEEWNLKLIENELQTYPYLSVTTTQYNVSNFDRIFEELERPFSVDNYRKVVPFEEMERGGCMVHGDYIQTYLMTTDEIDGLKFENTRVVSSADSVTIITSVRAMNKIMYDQNMPALDSILRMAVQQFPCNEGRTAMLAYRQSFEEKLGVSSVSIAVIAVLGSGLVCGTVLVIFVIVRLRKVYKVSGEKEVHTSADEKVFADEDAYKSSATLYSNDAFDDSTDRSATFSGFPTKHRRLT
ncbi:uncharacterized protein [Magallana gigas]